MLEKYKSDQPLVYKTIISINENKNNNHAFLFNVNDVHNFKDIIINFVKSILCPKHGECGGCSVCNRIDNNNFPELIILETNGLTIKKEQLINLKKNFSKKSFEGKFRIYIIYDVDKFNQESANSILKFLEEPEENIIAVLTTNQINKVMSTIKSRCQIINLIKTTNFVHEMSTKDKINNILLNIVETKISEEKVEMYINSIVELVKMIDEKKKKVLARAKDVWHKYFIDKESTLIGLDILIFIYRDILECKINGEFKIFNDYEKELKKITINMEIVDIIKKIDKILLIREKAITNVNQNLLFDKLIIELGSDN